ncbi:rhomboid family intramembrane serine protease [Candidatus Dactylopiibacterium carminicum]|nr:rhomboid family intramembrane serine protease [Candidatus Dactylopiibacterium carminicum]
MFLHASIWHLVANLLSLAMFAPRVARAIGLLPAVVLASIAGELANHCAAWLIERPVIGASATVFALAGAQLLLFPHDHAARAGITLLIVVQAVLWFAAPNSSVAWSAHLIGAALGWAGAIFIHRVSPGQRGAPRCKVRQE